MSQAAVGKTPVSPTGYVLVYDSRFAEPARQVAAATFLEARPLDAIALGGLAQMAQLVVYADLKNLDTARMLRACIGKAAPSVRRWWFFVAPGQERHASQVQADALGATGYLARDRGPNELRRVLSVAGQSPLTPERAALLRRSAAGETVLGAGAELAELFGSLATGRASALREVTGVGADINKSVGAVGPEQWLATVRDHHEGTFQHCLLVSGVVAGYVNRHIADPADGNLLATAALLHDIGKAQVPQHVLDKPGRLNDAEFEAIKTHPGAGFDYLVRQRGIDPAVLDAVRHHHEALDGSGYPDGLRADRITPMTRILTVCDVFAALVEVRSYKPAKPPDEAISILVKMAIEDKVDYRAVRKLAQVFDMNPPETLAEVKGNLAAQQVRAAS